MIVNSMIIILILQIQLVNKSIVKHDALLKAIQTVESGNAINEGFDVVADSGKSIGPFCISEAYWKDAVAHDKTLGGTYQDCRKTAYARKVVLAYWDRYAPNGASDETLARLHNGGPKGHKKKATLSYWNKVKKYLAQ